MVSNLINQYGGEEGTLAVVEYHISDSFQEPWCGARVTFYATLPFEGTPTMCYDGQIDAWPISTMEPWFHDMQAIPTPVTIELGAEETAPGQYEATVRTCLEAGADPLALRIYALVVEDHYPASPSYSRNTFRSAGPTQDISLNAEECTDVVIALQATAATQQDNLKIIAWAQQPHVRFPADVFQAAMETWPFEPLQPQDIPGDLNGDGLVNAADLALLLGVWGPVEPCDPPIPADLNQDCAVDSSDLALLLGNWGS